MKKITTADFIVEQLKNENLYQIEQKSLYARKIDNITKIYSYDTKIAEYDKITNILKITKAYYSMTTSKHKNILKKHFARFANSEILEI